MPPDYPTTASLREQPQQQPPLPDAQDVDLSSTLVPDETKPSVVVKFPDGSVEVSLGKPADDPASIGDTEFDENLALHIDQHNLSALAEDLLRGIEDDDNSRKDWLDDRANALKLLALQVERPGGGTESATPVPGQSRVRDVLLLEAALRFQANARGELLPTDGPVKIRDETGSDTLQDDVLAQALQDDFNYFLTVTASEYYPDTDRMLFLTGVGGTMFKKVYRCPLRRRPVSESVDAADLIVSNGATDLRNADRITHVVKMRQSTMKRMQFLKVYREVNLGQPTSDGNNSVEDQKEEITGVRLSSRPEDTPYTLYECLCMIDVPGDEHKENGEITGLPRPYKVTIDKTSHQVLEIRRNWREDDELEQPREVFVKYPFVPGLGFYEIGLAQIAGNPATAATALLRIMVDSGIYGNFPGGLVVKAANRQNTTDMAVPPGGFIPVDTSAIPSGDIRAAVMPLPYKEAGPGIFQLYENIRESGSRVAGVAEIQVGEGKQDAPVGTTIALIEQATKVLDAVHKRLHTAQAKEFELLRDLFKESPQDFWRFNKKPSTPWDEAKLTAALNDYDLVPVADPNTSSDMMRVMRAQALYMMAKADPSNFDIQNVYEYVLQTIKVHNTKGFLRQSGPPAPDPKAQAAVLGAQADLQDSQTKAAELAFKIKNSSTEDQNRDLDRQSDQKIAAMNLEKEVVIHRERIDHDQAQQARGLVADHLKHVTPKAAPEQPTGVVPPQ